MQLVTAQLSERVGHLMDIAEVQAAADAAAKQSIARAANAKATDTYGGTACGAERVSTRSARRRRSAIRSRPPLDKPRCS